MSSAQKFISSLLELVKSTHSNCYLWFRNNSIAFFQLRGFSTKPSKEKKITTLNPSLSWMVFDLKVLTEHILTLLAATMLHFYCPTEINEHAVRSAACLFIYLLLLAFQFQQIKPLKILGSSNNKNNRNNTKDRL